MFINCGADLFELKPTTYERIKSILERYIDTQRLSTWYK